MPDEHEQYLARLELYDKIAQALDEIASGARPIPLDETIRKIRSRYCAHETIAPDDAAT